MSLSTPNEHRAQEAKKGGAGEHPSSVRRERVPVSSGKLGALESVGEGVVRVESPSPMPVVLVRTRAKVRKRTLVRRLRTMQFITHDATALKGRGLGLSDLLFSGRYRFNQP